MNEQHQAIIDHILEDVNELLPNANESKINEVAAYIANIKFITAQTFLSNFKSSNIYNDCDYLNAEQQLKILEDVAFELLGRQY